MGLDTKTYWLTDRQSQCDFDFDLIRESLETAVTRVGGWCEMAASMGFSHLEPYVSCGTVASR
jgi:hypothetical protein